MNSPLKTKWLCRKCFKYLSSKRSYDEHMNIHNESRPFGCDQCNYAAASQMTLRRHKLRNHIARQDWGYQCPYCEEAYMEPASYQQHVLTRHFGRSATFGCPHAGCAFTSKSSKHFREHVPKHLVVFSSHGSPPIRRHGFLRPDFTIAAHLVDDELGSGHGKEALKPVARRVTNILSLAKPAASLISHRTSFMDCARQTKSFMVLDREFLKTPINLERVAPLHPERQAKISKVILSIDKVPSVTSHERLATARQEDYYLDEESNTFRDPEFSLLDSLRTCDDMNGADWIENEIVIDDVLDQPTLLSDGQIDIELD